LFKSAFQFIDDKEKMREDLKNPASNGFGIEIVNINEPEWYLSPKVYFYYQYDLMLADPQIDLLLCQFCFSLLL
jgi:hypothetical protein